MTLLMVDTRDAWEHALGFERGVCETRACDRSYHRPIGLLMSALKHDLKQGIA